MNKHTVATVIGCIGLLVAVTLPVVDRFMGVDTSPVVLGIVASIGLVFVGSQQVTRTAAKLIRAWRGDR